MTQRIFDTDNEKDMADLWDILPDDVIRIKPVQGKFTHIEFDDDEFNSSLFAINWHDKTEIHRPIKEETEADIGKLCYFWDNDEEDVYGILEKIDKSGNDGYPFKCKCYWQHCRRLTKEELEEMC